MQVRRNAKQTVYFSYQDVRAVALSFQSELGFAPHPAIVRRGKKPFGMA
jgi:hypothetical protein